MSYLSQRQIDRQRAATTERKAMKDKANAVRPKSKGYNIKVAEDAEAVILLRESGLPFHYRHPKATIEALRKMPRMQRLRIEGNPNFVSTREQGKTATPVKRSILPRSLSAWVQEPVLSALETYYMLWAGAMPSVTANVSERASGGGVDADPYDHDALEKWSRAKKQLSSAERKTIEIYFSGPDDALLPQSHMWAINSGGRKLAEYFGGEIRG